jgi:predicted HAD superfamily Cof-like phosphohydrolase
MADSPARSVQEWMRAAGHPVHSHPQDFVPAATAALRTRLMWEESAELAHAIAHGNLAAVAQELADVVVVAYGTAAAYGLDLDRAIDEVMAANRSKFVDGKPVLRADGKVLKGPNYQPPDMERVVELCRIFGRSTDRPIPAHVTKQAPMEQTA